MARRILPALLVVAVALTACTTGSGTATTAGTTAGAPTTTTSLPAATTTSGPGTTTTTVAIDLSALDLPAEVRRQLAELVADAQEVRGLAFLEPPDVAVVSPDELEVRVRGEIEEVADDFPADEALYQLLGLLDPEADLEAVLADLYGGQVAGLYDLDTGEIVVRARDDELSVVEQSTMVHELVHALVDQHFGLSGHYRAMTGSDRLDQALAYQALIEGDATLAQVIWLRGLSAGDLGDFVTDSLEGVDTTALDETPRFLVETLMFPYDSGLGFAQSLYRDGGWEAVNEAYSLLVELPGSSEQVITPDDYRRDLPVELEIPRIDLPGYQLQRTSVWGEARLRIMLGEVLGPDAVLEAADGWGGDAYHQWFDGSNAALLLVYEGDTPGDVEELRRALLEFALASVPEEDFVWVATRDGRLYFIAADVPETGEALRAAAGLN